VALKAEVDDLLTTLCREIGDVADEIMTEESGCDVRTDDAWPLLRERGLVHEVEPGICYLLDGLAGACDRIDEVFLGLARDVGAIPATFGTVLPISSVLQNQYLANFPHHALFVATAHQSLSSIRSIAKCSENGGSLGREIAGPIRYLLAPTVCYHCFEAMRGRELRGNNVYTARGFCHRFETRNAEKLFRLHAFNMREIIFYGSFDFVEKTRNQILEFCVALLGTRWGGRLRVVTASDPFFGGGRGQRFYQAMRRSKYELQLHVPWCDRWIAVMSFNHHERKLAAKYQIGPKGTNSGCFGVGYERLLYALACQKGIDAVLALNG
jgi:hypothetical protein